MLCLKVDTQSGWIESAIADLDRVLIDHAHCEKKAALNAYALISRYPERDRLVREMISLAQEETDHFQRVYRFIRGRGAQLARDPGDPYVQELHALIRRNEPGRMLDALLVAALVEARSCERFSILSRAVADKELREFYRELLASEAGHYRTFVDIAKEYFPADMVASRLDTLADAEAEIIFRLTSAPAMHG